jgi:predicted dehydrogenase
MYNGAIIGFGKIARTNHIQAYFSPEISSRLNLTSVVEPNYDNLERGKKEFPGLHFYNSVEELFKNENVAFVDITAPPPYHFEILKQCISNRVHIICEKPFTLQTNQAREIKTMLENSGLVFIPCHQYKYSPVWKEFKNFVEMNSKENKVFLQFNIFRTGADPGLKPDGKIWRTGSRDTGGGILADTGVHYLYLSLWILGGITKVSAQLLNLAYNKINCEDTALINLEGEKGVVQIALTWAADKRYNSTLAVCRDASLNYTGGTNLILYRSGFTSVIDVPDMSDKINYTNLYISLFNDFYNALVNKEQKSEWINEAYNSICLMNECYKAAEG